VTEVAPDGQMPVETDVVVRCEEDENQPR